VFADRGSSDNCCTAKRNWCENWPCLAISCLCFCTSPPQFFCCRTADDWSVQQLQPDGREMHEHSRKLRVRLWRRLRRRWFCLYEWVGLRLRYRSTFDELCMLTVNIPPPGRFGQKHDAGSLRPILRELQLFDDVGVVNVSGGRRHEFHTGEVPVSCVDVSPRVRHEQLVL